ncbi:unnamed protein product [Zymoseptoria tritici ST99CH_1E4]|uniref:Uncharacterized protein n=1 Tax=Zymoseptoria tritici ST99CH_1E4 TaxID=1276532 RepID=A0A2H1G3M1_ZYMTR|nr:unnamed protein product [Zymoseptoria tritici ST99CH_1E4]
MLVFACVVDFASRLNRYKTCVLADAGAEDLRQDRRVPSGGIARLSTREHPPSPLLISPEQQHTVGKSLNDQLRLLDDAFLPTMTPTNTWLATTPESTPSTVPVFDIIEPLSDVATRQRISLDLAFQRDPTQAIQRAASADIHQESARLATPSSAIRSSSLPPAVAAQPRASPTFCPSSLKDSTSDEPTPVHRAASDPCNPPTRSRAATVIHSNIEDATSNHELLQTYADSDGGDEDNQETSMPDDLFQPLERQLTTRHLTDIDELNGSPEVELSDLEDLNEGREAMNDVQVEIAVEMDEDSGDGKDAMDDWGSVHSVAEQYEEGIETLDDGECEESPALESMPSFQIRLFDPESSMYGEIDEYREMPALIVEEWSGEVKEMPSIQEEETELQDSQEEFPASIKRRLTETHVTFPDAVPRQAVRRTSTMTEFCRLKGRVRSPVLIAVKGSPASPAVTACTVRPATSATLNPWYEQPDEPRNQGLVPQTDSKTTAQTIQSDLGTCQMLWEEVTLTQTGSKTLAQASSPRAFNAMLISSLLKPDLSSEADDCPIENLKTKLPRHSHQSSRLNSSLSSAKPSAPPTPSRRSSEETPAPNDDEEDEEPPLSLYLKPSSPVPFKSASQPFTTVFTARRSSLPTPLSITRHLAHSSTVEGEASRFAHRDSVDVYHARGLKRHETEAKMNQELMNSRDSFVITKSKFEARWGKGGASSESKAVGGGWNRFAGLETIEDASPPGRVGFQAVMEMSGGNTNRAAVKDEAVGALNKEEAEDRHHPDEHVGCPICEEHRPRWFEEKYRAGKT